jgi:hypothetical protein
VRDPGGNGINEPVQQRIEGDGKDGRGDNGVHGSVREQSQLFAEDREDERELADLGQGHGHSEGNPKRIPQQQYDTQRREWLAEQDDTQRDRHQSWGLHQVARVQQHAYCDKEQNGKGITHGECL